MDNKVNLKLFLYQTGSWITTNPEHFPDLNLHSFKSFAIWIIILQTLLSVQPPSPCSINPNHVNCLNYRVYYDLAEDHALMKDLCEAACNDPNLDLCHVRKIPSLGDISKVFPMNWRFVPLLDPQVQKVKLCYFLPLCSLLKIVIMILKIIF